MDVYKYKYLCENCIYFADGESTKEPTHDTADHDPKDATGMPAVVVYMIDPFSYGNDYDQINRLAMLGLLRCYLELRSQLSDNLLNNIQLQVSECNYYFCFHLHSTMITAKTCIFA